MQKIKWELEKLWLRLKLYVTENYYNEAESLIIWYAVCFGLGCAFYFAFPWELPIWGVVTYLEAVLLLLYLYRNQRTPFKALTYVAVFACGLCIAKANALYQAQKVELNIPEETYISGEIRNIDYGRGNRQRLLLTNVNNFEKPLKGDFRISLNYPLTWLQVGQCVELVARIPQQYSPDALSNYNLKRTNFYKEISATGYAISPIFVKPCLVPPRGLQNQITNIREQIKTATDKYVTENSRGIIRALTIGDRSLISEHQTENYRTAGLAHILAISGMHMGLIALLIFFLIRIVLSPLGYGKYDLRKPSAIVAFLCTLGYYLISGQSVSCTRAFLMTSLIMFGVLVNRRTISFRLWGFALIIVLCVDSVAVISPGFLMSFGASLGLISFYEKNMQTINGWFKSLSIINRLCTYVLGILVVDIFACMMTIPYSMYFFKQISVYTCLGNLIATPLIAFAIMPTVLGFFISLPLGGESYTLQLLDKEISLLNNITEWVSGLPLADAGEGLAQISSVTIFSITLGLLWLCIWQAKWRYWGILLILCGMSQIAFTPKPDFVFDDKGETFVYRRDNRLQSSCWHANSFLERMWTGSSTRSRADKNCHQNNADIKCTADKCIYKNRIEFAKGYVKFDGKDIPLRQGGYIDLKRGVSYYHPEPERIWNRKPQDKRAPISHKE